MEPSISAAVLFSVYIISLLSSTQKTPTALKTQCLHKESPHACPLVEKQTSRGKDRKRQEEDEERPHDGNQTSRGKERQEQDEEIPDDGKQTSRDKFVKRQFIKPEHIKTSWWANEKIKKAFTENTNHKLSKHFLRSHEKEAQTYLNDELFTEHKTHLNLIKTNSQLSSIFTLLAESINFLNFELSISHRDLKDGRNVGLIHDSTIDTYIPVIYNFQKANNRVLPDIPDIRHFCSFFKKTMKKYAPVHYKSYKKHFICHNIHKLDIHHIQSIIDLMVPKQYALPLIDKLGQTRFEGSHWLEECALDHTQLWTKNAIDANEKPEIVIHMDTTYHNIYARSPGRNFVHIALIRSNDDTIQKLNLPPDKFNVNIVRNDISMNNVDDEQKYDTYAVMNLETFYEYVWVSETQLYREDDGILCVTFCLCEKELRIYTYIANTLPKMTVISKLGINEMLEKDYTMTRKNLFELSCDKFHTIITGDLFAYADEQGLGRTIWEALDFVRIGHMVKNRIVKYLFHGFPKGLKEFYKNAIITKLKSHNLHIGNFREAHFNFNVHEWSSGFKKTWSQRQVTI